VGSFENIRFSKTKLRVTKTSPLSIILGMGTLYIVATPIGNIRDISFRAVEVLYQVQAIACEDTRKTGLLLKAIEEKIYSSPNIRQRPELIAYYEKNELQKIPQIITALKNGFNIALVSDAGTPTISDPGFKLVRECVRVGIAVESIPGASSVIAALTVSALPTDKFFFVGYLPHKPGHRMTLLAGVKKSITTDEKIHPTVILFEAPHRLLQGLEELKTVFGDINIVICRELTKVYQEVRREKISGALIHFKKQNPKGEFVILFNVYGQN